MSPKFLDTELGKFPRLSDINEPIISTQSHVNGNISLHGRHLNYDEDKVEDNNNDNNGVNSLHTQHDHYSTTVELPFFLRQAQDRTRLVNSGGLAGRRPPTRIVTSVFLRVNSPFASFHGTSATSSSHSQVISNSNPSNANNHSSCETIFSNLSKGSTDCKILPKQTPPTRKPISYQLPGLTDNSFQTLTLNHKFNDLRKMYPPLM
ncbi:unnamed protein product [Heterobilharzia americana]|nr:unnamed protein product [Heterobilharzia americana]